MNYAEYKDDSLTWKDIKVIVTGADSLLAMKSKKELIEMGEEGYYTAILKEYEQLTDMTREEAYENIDLTKILDGCPKGTKFYSSFYGEVSFDRINGGAYPVILVTKHNNYISVTPGGKHIDSFDGECSLFPSKYQRDWSKFVRFWDKPKIDMKCKELQFGDWIADNNGFRWQIIGVGDDYAYATFEGNEGDPWELSDDQPEPIPLTPEILEKNGLKYEVDYGRYHRSILGSHSIDKEPLICVQWNPQGEISQWEVSNKSGILTGVVAYGYTEIAVHELQHILRMVGLNNIADNFKV